MQKSSLYNKEMTIKSYNELIPYVKFMKTYFSFIKDNQPSLDAVLIRLYILCKERRTKSPLSRYANHSSRQPAC
jgi:hypothetical protein